MHRGEKAKNKATAISAVLLRRRIWRTNPIYCAVSEELLFPPFDVLVMNVYDALVPGGGATYWKLKATSNKGFFLFPDKKVKEVKVAAGIQSKFESPSKLQGSRPL